MSLALTYFWMRSNISCQGRGSLQSGSHDLIGLIILSGPEATGDDHEVRLSHRLQQRFGNAFEIIPDRGDLGHHQTGCSQFSRGIPGIEVNHPAGNEFIANRYNLTGICFSSQSALCALKNLSLRG
jgi:hypothetical protein